jgi:hypothetical protein
MLRFIFLTTHTKNMDKYILALILGIVINHYVNAQATVYVSQDEGHDTQGNGSIQNPYKTIGKAISIISESDTVIIREGIYHEQIIINNLNATEGLPTVIKNYQNETVIIDGTIEVNGTWSDDPDNNNVKLIENITSPITQLFVGNNQMVMARWPNAQFNDLSIFDKHNWAEGHETSSLDGQLYIDETKKDPGTIDLANSIGILNIGSFKTFNRVISSHTQQVGNDLIEYLSPIGNSGIGGALKNNGPLKDKHHYFFFEGKKDFVDIENEWFLDTVNNKLYVYPSSQTDINNRTIRGKIRDYSLLVDNSSHIKIEGLTFFATTFKADSSSYLNISNCNFYYPSYSRRMLGELQGAAPTTLGSSGAKRVHNSTIDSCLFMDSEGEGLLIMGNNNKVLNSYFKNIDWSATELDGLMVTINVDGNGNEFSYNEIYNTGASATVWPGEESIFSYNVVSNTGLAQSDGAVFQGTKNTVSKSVVHHNFVYDTEKYAFRYDAPGGNAEEAGSFGIMHHNIADNTMGLMIKGNNQIIANNTVINTINNRNDIIILAEDCSNNSTWLYNNLAERIGSHRSSTQFELTTDAPIPIGTVGYIMYDSDGNGSKDSWRECQGSDGSIYSGTGDGESMNNIDQITAVRSGISLQSNVTSLIQYNVSDSKTVANYAPNSTVLFDNGVSPTNLVNISPTESKTLDELVPQNSVGDNPDIGAIDQSNLWTPGINWSPVEEFQIENMYTTLNQTVLTNKKVFIYPNPTNDILHIKNAQISRWKIFNFGGQLLQTGNTNWVDLSSHENGLYLMQLEDVFETYTLTIIKK